MTSSSRPERFLSLADLANARNVRSQFMAAGRGR
jgi:hypothetical protein